MMAAKLGHLTLCNILPLASQWILQRPLRKPLFMLSTALMTLLPMVWLMVLLPPLSRQAALQLMLHAVL